MHYGVLHIADVDFLLPHEAELSATDDQETQSEHNHLDRCREFKGESTIKYGSPPTGASRVRDPPGSS